MLVSLETPFGHSRSPACAPPGIIPALPWSFCPLAVPVECTTPALGTTLCTSWHHPGTPTALSPARGCCRVHCPCPDRTNVDTGIAGPGAPTFTRLTQTGGSPSPICKNDCTSSFKCEVYTTCLAKVGAPTLTCLTQTRDAFLICGGLCLYRLRRAASSKVLPTAFQSILFY